MDREAIARGRRRQEALDSLELERQREAALVERLELAIRDLEAWRADEAAFAHMEREDVELLRRLGFTADPPSPEAFARLEARVLELEREVADARRRQEAYRRYAEALDEPS